MVPLLLTYIYPLLLPVLDMVHLHFGLFTFTVSLVQSFMLLSALYLTHLLVFYMVILFVLFL